MTHLFQQYNTGQPKQKKNNANKMMFYLMYLCLQKHLYVNERSQHSQAQRLELEMDDFTYFYRIVSVSFVVVDIRLS